MPKKAAPRYQKKQAICRPGRPRTINRSAPLIQETALGGTATPARTFQVGAVRAGTGLTMTVMGTSTVPTASRQGATASNGTVPATVGTLVITPLTRACSPLSRCTSKSTADHSALIPGAIRHRARMSAITARIVTTQPRRTPLRLSTGRAPQHVPGASLGIAPLHGDAPLRVHEAFPVLRLILALMLGLTVHP